VRANRFAIGTFSAGGNDSLAELLGLADRLGVEDCEHGLDQLRPLPPVQPAGQLFQAGANDDIALPSAVQQPDWELELAVVIGRPARHVPRERALNFIAGYTIGNDITARDRVFRPDVAGTGADRLIEYASSITELRPGDLLLTGSAPRSERRTHA
jgi:2-keto-4-pentenoate hydratase/2-oxohepta-3-ene-1,7-dioic acid hydratase in catechol pathway